MTEQKKTVYRDSRDGRFKTQREAERKPDVHEKERVRVHPPEPKKK